ncbi:MAG: PIN domain-containing protein [Candidatus Omnitrophota bacterium]
MDIALDTNIYFSDFFMKSKRFEVVFDYLKKTNSKIIVPQIVYQEIATVYEREFANKLDKFNKSFHDLGNMLVDNTLGKTDLEIKDEVKKYLVHFLKKLNIKETEVIPYRDEYLRDIVKRALKREKPCTEKGEEFRDVLIWLTILDIARISKNKELIFISNNIHQFASEDGTLFPSLRKEAENANLNIKYYKSLDKFIEDHASKFTYITKEWLMSILNIETVNKYVIALMDTESKKLLERAETMEEKSSTGYYNPINSSVELDSFYVYEKTDGTFYIEADYYGEIEIEFEFEYEEAKSGYKYEPKYNPLRNNIDIEPVYYNTKEWKSKTKCLYPTVNVKFGITVKENDIQDAGIVDWYFA